MRPFFVTVIALLTLGVLARPAGAQWGPPRDSAPAAEAPAAPDAAPADAPPAVDPAVLRELREQVFAHESLRLSGSRVLRGDEPMRITSFYALVGRADLNDSIHRRRAAKWIVFGAGAAATAVGVTWGILDGIATDVDNGLHRAVNLCGSSEIDPKCADQSHASMAPWAIAFGGAVTMLTGAVFPTDPLDRDGKAALVDDYNRRLRANMNLAGAVDTAARSATVRAAVLPGQSGMLLASCSF